jgi:hypothetical protein
MGDRKPNPTSNSEGIGLGSFRVIAGSMFFCNGQIE